jgi:hypothetical protein
MLLKEKTKSYNQYNTDRPAKVGIILAILFTLSIGLIPINVFSRGGFQVADIIIVPLIAYFLFTKYKIESQVKKLIFMFLPFVIWTQLVMFGYFLNYKFLTVLKPAINMLYAFFMLIGFTNAWNVILSDKAYRYIYLALIISIICVFSFKGIYESWGSYETEAIRSSYSFNNPNQLALYALTLLGIIIILMKIKKNNNVTNKIYFSLDMFFIIVAHFLVIKSVSRAGIAAFLVVDLCLLKNMFTKDLFVPVAITISAGVLLLIIVNPQIKEKIEERGVRGFSSSAFEARLEDSIIRPLRDLTGLKLLYGTGYIPMLATTDSELRAKSKALPGKEVHNMFLNALWGFGAIGLIFFAYWIFQNVWGVREVPNALWIWASLLTIGATHALFRSRMFWLIVSLMLALLNMEMAKGKIKEQEGIH